MKRGMVSLCGSMRTRAHTDTEVDLVLGCVLLERVGDT